MPMIKGRSVRWDLIHRFCEKNVDFVDVRNMIPASARFPTAVHDPEPPFPMNFAKDRVELVFLQTLRYSVRFGRRPDSGSRSGCFSSLSGENCGESCRSTIFRNASQCLQRIYDFWSSCGIPLVKPVL